MVENTVARQSNDDPRKLSALILRVSDLAFAHSVPSVVIGLVAREGDLVFPEYVNYLSSALRVEDGVFRMTRERVVLHLADVDAARAGQIVERLIGDFCDEFPAAHRPEFQMTMLEVKAGTNKLRVKDVLTQIFAPPRMLH